MRFYRKIKTHSLAKCSISKFVWRIHYITFFRICKDILWFLVQTSDLITEKVDIHFRECYNVLKNALF